ncbi:MAG: 2-hydroxyacyl-CoA dehydratase [Oscillospiraceae bacterium]|nr:2-hydroxyacyl-CoA dehydratase [Oscillospiraceae bacterium]
MNEERGYVAFTEDMIATHTILVPTMLPMHFKMILAYLRTYGYKLELLETSGPHIAETGLKYVHNDTCYPAILVIGQLMDAINSGKYDIDKLALVQFQTGGGCRASNYIYLLRKALKKAGLGHIPVISISFQGLETHPGFKLDVKKFRGMMYGMLYGDLLMTLVNQTRPYELEKGTAQKLADEWTESLGTELGTGRVSYKDVKENYRRIIDSFARIPMEKRPAVKVGVVGEIFVKYSPLGNNNLEQFLTDEGAEVVVPGLMDFCLYCITDGILDHKLYGRGYWKAQVWKVAFKYLNGKKQDMIDLLKEDGRFEAPTPFIHTLKLAEEYLGLGAKMGEGWLLTGEMIELIESGCKNIVCTQPFGCLPNHIVGKGMMKPIKERNPDVNIVAIDYDASSSKVNQENRLKLMLSNARANLEAELAAKEEKETVMA